jgi:Protein of unknown function (DUF2786)
LLRRIAEGLPDTDSRGSFTALPAGEQCRAIEAEFDVVAAALVGAGWTPLDLSEFGRRKGTGRRAGRYLLAVVAKQTAAHPPTRVHPRWRDQLDQLDATAVPSLAQWRADDPWPALADELIDLLAELCCAPALHPVLPAPGAAPGATTSGQRIDAKVLRRVRALLAKAESTEFDEEAEALSAKAQSLMRQHSIDRTLAEVFDDQAPIPAARRLWLDSPYAAAKAMLVAEVAEANRCRYAITDELGFVTVMGFETDLDVVELLATSLLLQASRAMRSTGSQVTRSGTSRTRSFRQSFLVAYGNRIGERLRAAAEQTEAANDARHDGGLLPVLAARDKTVHEAFAAAFPHLRDRSVRISNAAGWAAGRAAADVARLEIRQSLDAESA